jgi:hypothetical protein
MSDCPELDHAWATIPRDPARRASRPRTVEPVLPAPGPGSEGAFDPPGWMVAAALTAGVVMPAALVSAWFNLLPGTR